MIHRRRIGIFSVIAVFALLIFLPLFTQPVRSLASNVSYSGENIVSGTGETFRVGSTNNANINNLRQAGSVYLASLTNPNEHIIVQQPCSPAQVLAVQTSQGNVIAQATISAGGDSTTFEDAYCNEEARPFTVLIRTPDLSTERANGAQFNETFGPYTVRILQNGADVASASTGSSTIQVSSTNNTCVTGCTLNALFASLDAGFYTIQVQGTPYTGTVTRDSSGNPSSVTITIPKSAINITYPSGGGGTGETGGDVTAPPTCRTNNPGVGWILCPIMTNAIEFLDELTFSSDSGDQGFLESILEFRIASTENGPNQRDALRSVWGGFRTLANLVFVISFFFVIYAAATGSVLGAYDVKRMLPRLLAAVVTVQLSFVFAIFLLDLFNDIGLNIGNLLLSPITSGSAAGASVDALLSRAPLGFVGDLAVGILFLILFIVVAFYAIVGILLMAVVFVIRNVALVVMIVVAPIFFALWVLPNTEKYFKKWWEWYIQLLMIFPIAALFFASGKLVSYIWIGATDTTGNANNLGEGDIGAVIIATLALFAPYFLAPRLFTIAGSAMASIANGVNNANDKIRQRSFYQRSAARAKTTALRTGNKALKGSIGRVGTYQGDNRFRQGASFLGRYTLGKAGNTKGLDRAVAYSSERVRKFADEDTQAASVLINEERAKVLADARVDARRRVDTGEISEAQADNLVNQRVGDFLSSQLADPNSSDERKRAAVQRLLVDNQFGTVGAFLHGGEIRVGTDDDGKAITRSMEGIAGSAKATDQSLTNKIINDNISAMSSKGPLYKPPEAGISGVSPEQITSLHSSYITFALDKARESGNTQAIDTFLNNYRIAMDNPSTRAEMPPGNIKDINAWVSTNRQALESANLSIDLDNIGNLNGQTVETTETTVQNINVEERLRPYNVDGGQAPTVGQRVERYEATRPPRSINPTSTPPTEPPSNPESNQDDQNNS